MSAAPQQPADWHIETAESQLERELRLDNLRHLGLMAFAHEDLLLSSPAKGSDEA